MTQIMIRLPVIGLLLCGLTGCSSLPPLNRALIRGEPKVVAEPQPSLADPRDQELAIAWETARLAEQRGMDREAIDAYLKVRKCDPSKPGVAHALAVLYDRAGMTDAASREYQAALRETPGDADLHCDYGYFLYSIGEGARSEASLRESLRLQPGHIQATVNLALLVGAQGRYDESQVLFTQAVGPAAALHNIGMLRLRAGDVDTATRLMTEARRRDPSIAASRPVLEWLSPHRRTSEAMPAPELVGQNAPPLDATTR